MATDDSHHTPRVKPVVLLLRVRLFVKIPPELPICPGLAVSRFEVFCEGSCHVLTLSERWGMAMNGLCIMLVA